MKKAGLLFLLVGILVIISAFFFQSPDNSRPVEVVVPVLATETVVPTMESQVVQPSFPLVTETSVPLMPTLVPKVRGFVLGDGAIDLASGRSTSLSITLASGNQLPVPSWANAIGQTEGEDFAQIFDPHAGTIYSLLSGETTVLLVHSGKVYYKPVLFGSNFDIYLTHDSDGRTQTFSEGQEKANGLIGSYAYICQSNDPLAPFTIFDVQAGCPGNILSLKITAIALIPRDQVERYDWSVKNGQILPWLQGTFPGEFGTVLPSSGFLLSTCVQQFIDQLDLPGIDPWVYNRVAVWFEIQ